MSDASVIESLANPVINGPYDPPRQHFELGADGTPTGTLKPGRRPSQSFVPIPLSKKGRKGQATLDFDATGERIDDNTLINDIRGYVELWRARNYPGVTPISRKLMLHWADESRENRVLFCQREAAETAIFLAEVAGKQGTPDFRTRLEPVNAEHNAGLPRVGLKMATGSGKTVVMAMLIAWQTLNKVHAPRDARFAKRFLIVAPGITIRDRLRVLLPSDPANYYRERELVPGDLWGHLHEAQVVIANYHQFMPRTRKEFEGVASNTKKILAYGRKGTDPTVETADEMVARVLRDFTGRNAGEIVVLNDEAHHCYQNRPLDDGTDKLDKEAEERNQDARVWFRGLQAVKRKLGVKTIYDLSATPFYLGGSGYQEGFIFPWVVSDFSLMDAIESGIVKVPRLPVDDDAKVDPLVYRNLWSQIGKDLPKKAGAKTTRTTTLEWNMPAALEGALRSLYGSYARAYRHWEEHLRAGGFETPPVFIVVCPNTIVSKLVFEWLAGYDVEQDDGSTRARDGELDLLRNVVDGQWLKRPNSILIDSAQLESGEGMKADFKAAVGHEIEQFKAELRARGKGADVDTLTDEDLLREVMNTVGKPGRLGERVRCVVSVGMLTEGWDANTVTHVLGVRAFGSRLLCEQVVGRALRRRNYTVNAEGRFEPEYAEVYGVPFDFIPADRKVAPPKPTSAAVRVRALPERHELRISFPRVKGYRFELTDRPLYAAFDEHSRLTARRDEVATWVEMRGQAGAVEEHNLDDLRSARRQQVAYKLAEHVLPRVAPSLSGDLKHWYFPQVVAICKDWIDQCLTIDDPADLGMLLLSQPRQRAVDKIQAALRQLGDQQEHLRPALDPFYPQGDTDTVDFPTRKVVLDTVKSPVNLVVLDGAKGNTWEEALAYWCEHDDRVAAYVKNDHLEFVIPYLYNGVAHEFWPDFLVRLARRPNDDVVRTLIVEVSGGRKDQDRRAEKAKTARDRWCVAVNNHGGFGVWGFVELDDPARFLQAMDAAIEDLYAGGSVTGGPEL